MKIFDIGCGDKPHPKALVCGDLYIEPSDHRKKNRQIKIKKIKNFIILDAHCLPFRDESFDWIYSSHVLEHLKHPLSALIEYRRVAPKILIKVPNVIGILFELETHLYSWSPDSLKNLLQIVYDEVIIYEHFWLLLWCREKGLIPQQFYVLLRHILFKIKFFKTIPIFNEIIAIARPYAD